MTVAVERKGGFVRTYINRLVGTNNIEIEISMCCSLENREKYGDTIFPLIWLRNTQKDLRDIGDFSLKICDTISMF